MQKNVGATEWIKDENENHFKNGNKGQKGLTKKLKDFVGKNETNVFRFCCEEGKNYVGYVGWKNLESYVEMVAGLPINEQNK